MNKGVNAVVFEGSRPESPIEEKMALVRQAALLDNLEKMNLVPNLDGVYLETNRPGLVEAARRLGAKVTLNDTDPGVFHFGNELQRVVEKHNLQRVICLNGSGCPLVTVEELEMICSELLAHSGWVYTNNTQSADIVAFNVPAGFHRARLPALDNSLAMTLRDQLGLEMALMPQSLGLTFDIDTPSDLLVLGSGPFAGRRTGAALESLGLDYSTLEKVKSVLRQEYEDVVLIGRVGAPAMERLNATLKLRLRVFSEERGMKALGRIESGEVVSLLGLLIDHAGLENFFAYLARVAKCALIDSRVLFCHYRYDIPARDRFLSDLGLWEEVNHPWLSRFTRAAAECQIPVLLGGHSLVSGSLWALCAELNPAAVG